MSNLIEGNEAPNAEQELLIRLERIFTPYARGRRDTVYANNTKFVHYTSAAAALNIINTKRLWMRNATCMADYREVQHGYDILYKYFADEARRDGFVQAVNDCVPGVADESIKLFDSWWADIRFNSYILSISEHDNSEDINGRLSMWRAYGGNNAGRVALVFRVPKFSAATDALSIMFSPVAYLTETQVHHEMNMVTNNIRSNREFLRSLDRSLVVANIFVMFASAVGCLKHEGFHEEREWRAIYSPKRRPSSLMPPILEVIGGVPQHVYLLPIDVSVSIDLAGIDLAQMFDRLIIGPSAYPWAMHEAFVDALSIAGVKDPANRVFASEIPIRFVTVRSAGGANIHRLV